MVKGPTAHLDPRRPSIICKLILLSQFQILHNQGNLQEPINRQPCTYL